MTLMIAALAVGGMLPSQLPGDSSEAARRLEVEVGADGVVSGSGAGAALALGLRGLMSPHVAATFDFTFGLEGAGSAGEDRWWTMPGVAWVSRFGPLAMDLGVSLGIGTVSGYPSTAAFFPAPFKPEWHVTAPTARVYLSLSAPVAARLEVFGTAEAGSLLVSATSTDAAWEGLTLGLRIGVL